LRHNVLDAGAESIRDGPPRLCRRREQLWGMWSRLSARLHVRQRHLHVQPPVSSAAMRRGYDLHRAIAAARVHAGELCLADGRRSMHGCRDPGNLLQRGLHRPADGQQQLRGLWDAMLRRNDLQLRLRRGKRRRLSRTESGALTRSPGTSVKRRRCYHAGFPSSLSQTLLAEPAFVSVPRTMEASAAQPIVCGSGAVRMCLVKAAWILMRRLRECGGSDRGCSGVTLGDERGYALGAATLLAASRVQQRSLAGDPNLARPRARGRARGQAGLPVLGPVSTALFDAGSAVDERLKLRAARVGERRLAGGDLSWHQHLVGTAPWRRARRVRRGRSPAAAREHTSDGDEDEEQAF